jgi:hypothetical protein
MEGEKDKFFFKKKKKKKSPSQYTEPFIIL